MTHVPAYRAHNRHSLKFLVRRQVRRTAGYLESVARALGPTRPTSLYSS